MIRSQLDRQAASVGGPDAVPVVDLVDVGVQQARPEGTLGLDVRGVEDHDQVDGFHGGTVPAVPVAMMRRRRRFAVDECLTSTTNVRWNRSYRSSPALEGFGEHPALVVPRRLLPQQSHRRGSDIDVLSLGRVESRVVEPGPGCPASAPFFAMPFQPPVIVNRLSVVLGPPWPPATG